MFTPTNQQDDHIMIGPAMKFHMEAQNLKHVDLQCALNFSRASQLTALLKPNSNPKWNTIQRVADALKVSVKSLVVTAQLLKEEAANG